MGCISDPKHHEVTLEVLDVFMGPPPKEDPNLIRLKEAGLTLARRVFHPPKVWPTKDVNKFIIKNLTLVKSQKNDLESEYFLFP